MGPVLRPRVWGPPPAPPATAQSDLSPRPALFLPLLPALTQRRFLSRALCSPVPETKQRQQGTGRRTAALPLVGAPVTVTCLLQTDPEV